MKTILFVWMLTSNSYMREPTYDWHLLAEVRTSEECAAVAKALDISTKRYRCVVVANPNR